MAVAAAVASAVAVAVALVVHLCCVLLVAAPSGSAYNPIKDPQFSSACTDRGVISAVHCPPDAP
jgi:hypothetical protein